MTLIVGASGLVRPRPLPLQFRRNPYERLERGISSSRVLHRGCGRAELHARCRKLRVAQPHLSRGIRRLGDELDVPLFARDRRRVTLTQVAAHFSSTPAAFSSRPRTLRIGLSARIVARRGGSVPVFGLFPNAGASIPPAWRLRSPKVSGVSPARPRRQADSEAGPSGPLPPRRPAIGRTW